MLYGIILIKLSGEWWFNRTYSRSSPSPRSWWGRPKNQSRESCRVSATMTRRRMRGLERGRWPERVGTWESWLKYESFLRKPFSKSWQSHQKSKWKHSHLLDLWGLHLHGLHGQQMNLHIDFLRSSMLSLCYPTNLFQ